VSGRDRHADPPAAGEARTDQRLDLTADPVEPDRALVDRGPSVVGRGRPCWPDAMETALREQAPHLEYCATGTRCSPAPPVTVPPGTAGRPRWTPCRSPTTCQPPRCDTLYGCGTSDMKAGDAMIAHLAARCPTGARAHRGVLRLRGVERRATGWPHSSAPCPTGCAPIWPSWPSRRTGALEAGCQGTLRAVVSTERHRAHSARSWLGSNAIHAAEEGVARLNAYRAARVDIDGCVYREGLQRLRIAGGVGNVVPAPARSVQLPIRPGPHSGRRPPSHVEKVYRRACRAASPTPPPAVAGLAAPAAQRFLAARRAPGGQYGWTDVSRFARALASGRSTSVPGDPNLAHTREGSTWPPRDHPVAPSCCAASCGKASAIPPTGRRAPGTHAHRPRSIVGSCPSLPIRRAGPPREHPSERLARPGGAAPREPSGQTDHDQRLLDSPRPVRLGAHRPVAGAAHPGGFVEASACSPSCPRGPPCSARPAPTATIPIPAGPQLGGLAGQAGFAVMTGGGRAPWRRSTGAVRKRRRAVRGAGIDCRRTGLNPWVDSHQLPLLLARKTMFVKYSRLSSVCPAGLGTLDELFRGAHPVRTKKGHQVPGGALGSSTGAGCTTG